MFPTNIGKVAPIKPPSIESPSTIKTTREIVESNDLILELQKKNNTLELENNELRLSVNRLAENISDLASTQESILQFTAEIKVKSKLIAKLQSDVTQLEQSLIAKSIRINDLCDELSSRKIEIDMLRITLRSLKSKNLALFTVEKTKAVLLFEIRKEANAEISNGTHQSTGTIDTDDIPYQYIVNNSAVINAVATFEKLSRRLRREILSARDQEYKDTEYLIKIAEVEHKFEESLNKEKLEFAEKLRQSQLKSDSIIQKLEFQIHKLENNYQHTKKSWTTKYNTLDSDQIINLRIVGSSAAIRVPKTVFNNGKDAVVLHVTFPSHNIKLSPDVGKMHIIETSTHAKDVDIFKIDLSNLPSNKPPLI